jgi:hypothetical protein
LAVCKLRDFNEFSLVTANKHTLTKIHAVDFKWSRMRRASAAPSSPSNMA